jgi:hypothetical protein
MLEQERSPMRVEHQGGAMTRGVIKIALLLILAIVA